MGSVKPPRGQVIDLKIERAKRLLREVDSATSVSFTLYTTHGAQDCRMSRTDAILLAHFLLAQAGEEP